jgi:hypothetical protein
VFEWDRFLRFPTTLRMDGLIGGKGRALTWGRFCAGWFHCKFEE